MKDKEFEKQVKLLMKMIREFHKLSPKLDVLAIIKILSALLNDLS